MLFMYDENVTIGAFLRRTRRIYTEYCISASPTVIWKILHDERVNHHVDATKNKLGRDIYREVRAMAEPSAGNRSTGFSSRFLRALEDAFIYDTGRVGRRRCASDTFAERRRKNSSSKATKTKQRWMTETYEQFDCAKKRPNEDRGRKRIGEVCTPPPSPPPKNALKE